MRVTNTMMRNNSLLNMQKNKYAYNKYLSQYNTQKKIQRPSEDPTVAVRALKYRTTLSEIDQYLSNIDDAISWMDATEAAISDIAGRLGDMEEYCTYAATGTLEKADRADLLAQLKQYAQYIYEQDANSDYAGRYIFTGYRTDVPLLFDKAQSDEVYTITEDLDIDSIRKWDYVYGEAAYTDGATADDYAGDASEFRTTHRILVSYHDLDSDSTQGYYQAPTLTYTDKDGSEVTVNVTLKRTVDDTTYNEHLNPGADEIYLIAETGELVFGDNVYNEIRAGSGLSITYQKSEFDKNDVRPEHYFKCLVYNKDTNQNYQYGNAGSQNIDYQVNFSQNLTVNTEACTSVSLYVGRTVDDISNLCDEMDIMEAKLTAVEKRIEDCDENDTDELAALNELKSQIETEMALQKTVLTNAISAGITVCKDALNQLNVSLADHGARYQRLMMTQSKLETQKIDTDEAKSENEDADLGEAYINFSEADLLYQATLNATSKILGQSLLNFI